MIFIEFFNLRQLLPACVYWKKGLNQFRNYCAVLSAAQVGLRHRRFVSSLLAAFTPALNQNSATKMALQKGTIDQRKKIGICMIHNGAKYCLKIIHISLKYFQKWFKRKESYPRFKTCSGSQLWYKIGPPRIKLDSPLYIWKIFLVVTIIQIVN